MLDPARCEQFRQALATLPLPTWDANIDAHTALYESQVLALGKQFFSKPPGRKRHVRLADDTLAAIGFKRNVLDFGRAWGILHQDEVRVELRTLEKVVSKLVQRDTVQFFDSLLEDIDSSGANHDHRVMFRLLRRLGRKKNGQPPGPRPLPMLRDHMGHPTRSFQEQQHIWMKQFAAIEAGTCIKTFYLNFSLFYLHFSLLVFSFLDYSIYSACHNEAPYCCMPQSAPCCCTCHNQLYCCACHNQSCPPLAHHLNPWH